jgi:hypothetical protein
MCSGNGFIRYRFGAEGVDICTPSSITIPIDPQAQQKIDFDKAFAFKDFKLVTDPNVYEFSDIDATDIHGPSDKHATSSPCSTSVPNGISCPPCSAKAMSRWCAVSWDRPPHSASNLVKTGVTVMGENKAQGTVKYIHGEFGLGAMDLLWRP